MVLNFWKNISNLGLSKSTEKNRYIVITNQVCLILLTISSVLFIIYINKGMRLSAYCYSVFFSILFITLFLNFRGFTQYSRQFLVISMPFSAIIPRLIFADKLLVEPLEYFYAFIICSFVPQLIFDSAKEKYWIIGSYFYYLFYIIFYDSIIPGYIEQMILDNNYKPSFVVFKVKQAGLYTVFNLVFGLKNYSNYLIEKDLLSTRTILSEQNEQVLELNNQINSKSSRLETNITMLSRVNSRLRANNEVLMRLSKSANIKDGDFHSSISEIGTIIYKTLDVSRVSIWAYDSFQHIIVSVFAISDDNKKSTDMPLLNLEKYPLYFITLNNNRIVHAENAYQNESTRGFGESYLTPNNIKSMLDVPFYIDGKLGGVICCENQNEIREWFSEDEVFIQSMADYVSLSFEAAERKNAQDIILKQKSEIIDKNNILTKQKEFINNINVELESKVEKRTIQLLERNQQLEKFAYANSHTIRGPLSRILGLLNLLDLKDTELDENMLLANIKSSANEVDEAIKEINEILTVDFPNKID